MQTRSMNPVLNAFRWAVATGVGTGLSPIAPATVGSAGAVLVYVALPIGPTSPVLWAMAAAMLVVGVWAAERSISWKSQDPSFVVCDEIAAMWLSLIWVPKTWPFLLSAFLLFRVFDVVKPFPIRRLEKLPGGWGIMADDFLAGIFTNVVLQVAMLLLHIKV